MKEDVMINGIKGCRKIKKDEGGEFLFVHCQEKIVLDAEQSGFSEVKV